MDTDGYYTAYEPAPAFLHFATALKSLMELGFVGEPIELSVMAAWTEEGDLGFFSTPLNRRKIKTVLFAVFVIYYVLYIIFALVLLLNLLIAMMGETYTSRRAKSTLVNRVNFARRVLRLELQLKFLHKLGFLTLNCGERFTSNGVTQWLHKYRNYRSNEEGGGTRGAPNPMFDDEVEREVEEQRETCVAQETLPLQGGRGLKGFDTAEVEGNQPEAHYH